MIKKNKSFDTKVAEVDDFCEECKKESKSVMANLITSGYKICDSCKISKTIFPI